MFYLSCLMMQDLMQDLCQNKPNGYFIRHVFKEMIKHVMEINNSAKSY